jgi:hypothetical protein
VLPVACTPADWFVDPVAARALLAARGVVALRGQVGAGDCDLWLRGTYAARERWTADFDDEQFTLGRAFYTHLEQGKSAAYFADAARSDALVERYAPGLQEAMRGLGATLTGARVHPRRGWCGAGVHVFPAGGQVAEHGGVIHFDTEGLSDHHIARRGRALSVVCMLRPPVRGGGLRVWDIAYDGEDHVPEDELDAESVMAAYTAGDVVAFDSYRLHQIQPFDGDLDRVSVTVHLAEIDSGHWESWF